MMPLSMNGMLSLSAFPEHQVIVYFKRENIDEGKTPNFKFLRLCAKRFILLKFMVWFLELVVKTSEVKRKVAAIYRLKSNTKKRLPIKIRDSLRAEEADLVSKLISGPSNFSHIQHMGPGDGLQILRDIPPVWLFPAYLIFANSFIVGI